MRVLNATEQHRAHSKNGDYNTSNGLECTVIV